MKHCVKKFALFLIFAAIFCSVTGCSDEKADTAVTVAPEIVTTADPNSVYDLTLTAEYNKDGNTVDTILKNKTNGLVVIQTQNHEFYKKNGSEWENITFPYAGYDNPEPIYSGDTFKQSYAAYPSTNDNDDNTSEAEKKQYLEAGEYKIVVGVAVCDPTEYGEIKDNDNNTGTVPLINNNRVNFTKEAYFVVE